MDIPLGVARPFGGAEAEVPMDAPAGGGGPGNFRLPLGVGFDDAGAPGALQAGGGQKPQPGQKTPTGQSVKPTELNVSGDFAWNPAITEAEELQQLPDRWSPQTKDFVAIAGGTVPVAPTFGNFLGAILERPDGGIGRLNLFSHSNKSMVAFGGHIEKSSGGPGANVFLDVNQSGDNLTAMDPTSMVNLNQPGVTFQAPKAIRGKKDFTVDDVRRKFAADAFIVLYLCHSGQDAAFLKQIATFFGVKVIGFSDLVVYHVPQQTSTTRFTRNGEQLGIGSGGTPVTDFRKLISDPKAVTATP
jgi:hypothetical protein